MWRALQTAVATVLVGVATSGGALAHEEPAAVIVLDGSGSMAGWLDGAKSSKIDMARTALLAELGKLPPTSAIGLVAFGHRRKANCGDVEQLAAASADALGKTLEALPRIGTTGKGPLVQALRVAAEAITSGPNRSIVLLHDDPDNCAQDACAAAQSIAKSHPGVPIHVITLGAKPATKAAMLCITDATGGKLLEVTNEATLTEAVGEAFKAAALDASVPAPKPATRPDAGASLEPGLHLSASLSTDGDPLAMPVRWRISKDGEAAPFVDVTAPSLEQSAPAGAYTVEAQAGLAKVSKSLTVEPGKPTSARLSFEAGIVKLAAHGGGESGEMLTITPLDGSGKKLTPLYVGRTPGSSVILPNGTYEVRLDDGLSRVATRIDVRAGGETSLTTGAALGRLELTSVSGENGPAIDAVTYTIETDDPGVPQGRREVARSAAGQADFTLPAGTYYVTARARQVEQRRQIAISAGALVQETIVLGLAQLTLSTKSSLPAATTSLPLKYRILSLSGEAKEVARSAVAEPQLTLPAGRYRVEATLGSENAKASVETEIVAGKDAALTLDVAAGQVTLERSGASSSIIDVMDESGAVVWHAGVGETATGLLAPGRYRYRTAQQAETTFQVKAGDRHVLKIP